MQLSKEFTKLSETTGTIQNTSDMPNDYENMSNAAYELSKHYYWNEIAANTHDIYSDLLK